MSRPATLPGLLSRAGLVTALLAALLLSSGGSAIAAPPTVPDYGPAIDAYARYEGQSTCHSTEQPGVRDFRALLQQAYGANTGGIVRNCTVGGRSEHKEGRAYDWMLRADRAADRAKADEFLNWLLATDRHGNRHAMARRFGVMYIIWNGRIWESYGSSPGSWKPYNGVNPHTDHIHFSFSWAGAKRQTTYWTAGASAPAPTSTKTSTNTFPDVPSNSYYAEPVSWMVEHEITTGFGKTGRFEPHFEVTRGQMAAFLWRMMDSPTGFPHHGFPDVSSSAYFDAPVRWLKAKGITTGYGNTGRFEPHRAVTRAEMVEFLYRTVNRPTGDARHSFPDVSRSAYYDAAVSWASAHGITTGYGKTGRFEPGFAVSRAQTSAFMHRLAGDARAWRAAPSRPSTAF